MDLGYKKTNSIASVEIVVWIVQRRTAVSMTRIGTMDVIDKEYVIADALVLKSMLSLTNCGPQPMLMSWAAGT